MMIVAKIILALIGIAFVVLIAWWLLMVEGCRPTPTPFVLQAASPELADVQAAIAQAQDGDTVNIPAGTATWPTGITINKGITLKGQTTTSGGGTAGATTDDQTVIIDETTKTVAVIQMNSDKPYRVTGLTFRGGTTPPNPAGHATLVLSNSTGRLNSAVRADHIAFGCSTPRTTAGVWRNRQRGHAHR